MSPHSRFLGASNHVDERQLSATSYSNKSNETFIWDWTSSHLDAKDELAPWRE